MPLWGYDVVKQVVHMFRHDQTESSGHTSRFSEFMKTLNNMPDRVGENNGDLSAFKAWVSANFGDPSINELYLEKFLAKVTPKEKKFWYIIQIEFLYDEFLLKPNTPLTADQEESLKKNRNQLIKQLNSLSDTDMLNDEILNTLKVNINNIETNFLKTISDDLDNYMKNASEQTRKELIAHLNLNEAAYNAADRTKKGTMILNGLVCGIIVAIVAWYFLVNYIGIAKGLYGLTGSLPSIKELASITFYLELTQKFFINIFSFVLNIVPSIAKIEGVSKLPSDVVWSLASLIPLFKVFSSEEGTMYVKQGAVEAFMEDYEKFTGVDALGTWLGKEAVELSQKNAFHAFSN
jgi:hypothetical protein